MKKALALILALSMVFCLAACSGTGDSNETVTLTVWVGENYVDVTNEMVESFKAANPDVTFDIKVAIESESTCKDTVLLDPTAAADVYTFADDQLLELVNNGAIQAVQNTESVIAANGAGGIAAATVDGTLYAYPMSASNGYFLYYDSSYFTEEDVQDLMTMCQKAAQAGKTVSFDMSNGWYLYSFYAGAGLTMVINDDGLTNSCDWNCDVGVSVTQAILDMVATGGMSFEGDAASVAAAQDGTAIATINGVWNSGAMQEAYGENYACAKLPSFTAGGATYQMSSFAGYKFIGVNPYSKNVGWAMKLAEWLTNEENQTKRFEATGDGPANTNAAASEAVGANPAIAALAQQSAYAVVQRVGNNYWTPATTLGEILSQGNPENIDLLTLLNDAVAGITADVT